MYIHQTTCEPPRPSLGRRIDLSEYRDPDCLQKRPQPSSPIGPGQSTVPSSPSSSLPPVALQETPTLAQPALASPVLAPTALPAPALVPPCSVPEPTPSHATVEVTTTAAVTTTPAGSYFGSTHSANAYRHIGLHADNNTHNVFFLTAMDASLAEKAKKAPKRKRVIEDSGETAKRRSARVRNTKCKKEEKIDFQELLFKYLPSRYRPGRRARKIQPWSLRLWSLITVSLVSLEDSASLTPRTTTRA